MPNNQRQGYWRKISVKEKLRIARIVTVPEAFVHIKPFIKYVREKHAEITLVCSHGPYEKVLRDELKIKIVSIEIKRQINIWSDLIALFKLTIFFRSQNFDIIHSSTPKAGLLVALAGVFNSSTIRLHTFTGQRWANYTGFKKWIFKFFDKIILKLNTKCYADSISQIEFLNKETIGKPNEISIIHKGSFGGVDINRFDNGRFPNAREEILSDLSLSVDSIILLFVGQICVDKGVNELIKAFTLASQTENRLKLILIGTYRGGVDQLDDETLDQLKNNPNIFYLGFKTLPEKYFSAADVFCLPSRREGFGTVIIEAAACGVPAIGTRIPGLVDAILDNETGVLVDVNNYNQLKMAILDLATHEEKRNIFGKNAKVRARTDFDSKLISELQWLEYQMLINNYSSKYRK